MPFWPLFICLTLREYNEFTVFDFGVEMKFVGSFVLEESGYFIFGGDAAQGGSKRVIWQEFFPHLVKKDCRG